MNPVQLNVIEEDHEERLEESRTEADKAKAKSLRRRTSQSRRAVPAAFNGIHRRRKRKVQW